MSTTSTSTESDAVQHLNDILTEHVGKENAITSQELSRRLGELDDLDSTPNTRAAIRELVTEEHVPVGACSNGYFLIETQAELEEYEAQLTERAYGILERRDAVRRAMTVESPAVVRGEQ